MSFITSFKNIYLFRKHQSAIYIHEITIKKKKYLIYKFKRNEGNNNFLA